MIDQYQYCDPASTLNDLHGDKNSLHRIVDAYLLELDDHMLALTAPEDNMRRVAHRLRAAFGIFYSARGSAISREIEIAYKEGTTPSPVARQQLIEAMMGLGTDLRRYLSVNISTESQ